MEYEELLSECDRYNLVVKEKPLQSADGRILNRRIAIRRDMPEVKKTCVLAEELGHYHTAAGDILDQTSVSRIKQERAGRLYAYDRLIGLSGIVRAYHHRCSSKSEIADYLGVTEEFLIDAVDCYKSKYGTSVKIGNYIIVFEPTLAVIEMLI